MNKNFKRQLTFLVLTSIVVFSIILSINYLNKKEASLDKLNIDSIYFYGDSITFGMGSSDGNDFATKTAEYFDVVKYNLSVSSQRVSNYHYTNNFRDAVSKVVPEKGLKKSILIIAFGTNDARLANPFLESPDNTPELYYSQFQGCLDVILKKGWLRSEIVFITPFYGTETDLATYKTDRKHYEEYVKKTKTLAKINHIALFDAYDYMRINGGKSLISSDNIHPNDKGHEVISEGLIAFLDKIINVK